jgi:Flp pilus assembly secretin CpaC
MPPVKNPLGLNGLQLRTLTILQALAEAAPGPLDEASGEMLLDGLPHAHGDHFHVGPRVVSGRDASGLANRAVWSALERKGLARTLAFPHAIALTAAGRGYDTGLRDAILHGHDH